jgi:hypothetical protein
MHYSDVPGGHGQVVNSISVPPIAYPGEAFIEPSLDTPSHLNNYVDGSSFHSHQQGSVIAIPRQKISSDDDSQLSAIVSRNVLCDHREDHDTGTYPPPPAQRDTQVTLHCTFYLTRTVQGSPYYHAGSPRTDAQHYRLCGHG